MLYRMNFGAGKLEPIDESTGDKNNLLVGTVLHMNGYNNPDYVIVHNFGIDERFPSYGAKYQTIGLEDFNYGGHDAHSLMWLRDKTSGMIQTYITEKVLTSQEVAELIAKADAKKANQEAYQKAAEIERARLEAIGRELFKKHIPEGTQALIVAECHVDDSDLMSDYHGHTTKDTVIIGYSMHKKDLFAEMRKAASRIPETEHLGPGKGHFEPRVIIGQDFQSNGSYYHKGSYSHWHNELTQDKDKAGYNQGYVFATMAEAQAFIDSKGPAYPISFDGQEIPFEWDIVESKIEHREKYSMGAGYYLKDGGSNSSGWSVSKEVKYRDQWDSGLFVSMGKRCIFETAAPIPPTPKKQTPKHTDTAEHTATTATTTPEPATHTEANKWWRSLSINEMKALEQKYKTIYGIATPSEIQEIYKKEKGTGITVSKNTEKAGIEIRFDSKPDAAVLTSLKSHGWRWTRFNSCWYHKDTPENWEFALTFAGQDIPQDIPVDSMPATIPDTVTASSHTAPKPVNDIPAKLRTLADGMEKAIDGKMNSATSQQNPTRRRLAMAEGMRKDGEQLQKVQFLLRALADMHEAGTVPIELATIKTKSAAEAALSRYGGTMIQSAVDIANGKPPEDPKAKTLRDLDRELIGCKIPGFFITPKNIAAQVVELADIREGMEVLEPSAGRGDIAELVNHGSKLTCIEYQQKLAGILELKGFNTICGDFLEHTGVYDRICQNPPFERGQDISHTLHAYQLLKSGGRLVSILGEGAFFRNDKVATDFRDWLEERGAEVIDLPAGAFQGTITSTGVKARIVVIDKE